MKTNIIEIHISGPVQSGKSAVLATIREELESCGYCVAFPDRVERRNPSTALRACETHEKPKADNTVFVLKESCD